MIEQSDQSLRASLRKVYGSIRALQRSELRRRLLATPEFFYCADELLDESLRRGILVAQAPVTDPSPGGSAQQDADPWLEIAGADGNLDAWP
jgi:hypothetical protein